MTADIVKQIMIKYKYFIETPDNIRAHVAMVKPVIFIKIIRTEGVRSLLADLASKLYFFRKSISSKASFTGSLVMLRSAITSALIIISAGSFFLYQQLITDTQSPALAAVVFITGDVSVYRGGELIRDLQVKTSMNETDTIITGSNSRLILQIRDTGLLTILDNTEISMTELMKNISANKINLSKGSVFSNLKKLVDKKYEIRTQNIVASVRGTSFLISHEDNRTTVKLLKGEVLVSGINDNGNQQLITAGIAADIGPDGRIQLRQMSEIEILELKKLALGNYLDGIDKMSIKDINDHFSKLQPEADKIDSEIQLLLSRIRLDWEKLTPSDRLRKSGKSLSELHLKGGEKIVGHIIKREGENLVVDTGDGVIRIPVADIIRRLNVK